LCPGSSPQGGDTSRLAERVGVGPTARFSVTPPSSSHLPSLYFDGPVWLASDMHLNEKHPRTREAFIDFLALAADEAAALLLPGDVFDAWVGDDILLHAPDWLRAITDALKQAGQAIPIYLGPGNRDFLLGDAFAQHTRTQRLPDQCLIHTPAGAYLLSHGDELCTDDVAYQQFRAMVRNPAWLAEMMGKTLPERLAIAQQLRERSTMEKSNKAADIMDVNQQAVEQAMQAAGVFKMIHGHTHRPDRHVFALGDQVCERIVLPDWDLDDAPPRGGWLILDQDGPSVTDIEAA